MRTLAAGAATASQAHPPAAACEAQASKQGKYTWTSCPGHVRARPGGAHRFKLEGVHMASCLEAVARPPCREARTALPCQVVGRREPAHTLRIAKKCCCCRPSKLHGGKLKAPILATNIAWART